MPVMIRVDGRAFHTFTRSMIKPFDFQFMEHMTNAALRVAGDMQGFKCAYAQSDEVTFCLTDFDTINTQGWFDYDLAKMVSISAALMTARFAELYEVRPYPVFDSRAFTVPVNDVVNAFLWRAKDWERNSLQMYARSFFSHKELHGKKRADIHEMLHSIGHNWTTDLTDCARNGSFLLAGDSGITVRHDVQPTFKAIDAAIMHLFVES